MKALVVHKNGVARVENVEEPKVTAAESVKIRIKSCGICGSDIPRVLENRAHYYPIILGHEFSGVVVDVGKNVGNVSIGDHVVGVPIIPCYHCEDCAKGRYSLCKNYTFIGSSLNGAMAEYIVIPAKNVVKINPEISFIEAAMVEPLTVALHGMKQNAHTNKKKVAILGMGTIGCLLAQAVRAFGASNVTGVVRNNQYDVLMEKIGIDTVINTVQEDWKEQASIITNGRGFDFVYETAGSTETMKEAFELAGNKAHICFIGTPKKEISFTVQQWEAMNRKEFYLTGSWMSYSGEFPGTEWVEAVKLIGNQVKIFPEMIHRIVKLENSEDVFADYRNSGSRSGRTILDME